MDPTTDGEAVGEEPTAVEAVMDQTGVRVVVK
jgi:hypothetical protein